MHLTDMLLIMILAMSCFQCWLIRENRPYKKPHRHKRIKQTIPAVPAVPEKRFHAKSYPERKMKKGPNES